MTAMLQIVASSAILVLAVTGCSKPEAVHKMIVCKSPLTENAMQQLRAAQVGDMDVCKKSKLDYLHKKIFLFDEVSIDTSGYATSEIETCWGYKFSERLKIQATPTHISFAGKDAVFSVNRKTMVGGNLDNENYTCEVSDIKISDRKI